MVGAQTILTIGALMLISSVILALNGAILNRDMMIYESEATLTATSLAQSLLEEVRTRSFDEQTVSARVVLDPTSLTRWSSLGPESGELRSEDFDDVDDYNGFARILKNSRFGEFNQEVKVYYVRVNDLERLVSFQTNAKRVDVQVRNSYIGAPDTAVTLSAVVAYH